MRLRGLPIAFLFPTAVLAQVQAPHNGPVALVQPAVALTNARLHPSAFEPVITGTLLLQGDTIASIGERVRIPDGAVVIDLHGRHVWPAFVEPFSDLGMPGLTAAEKGEVPNGTHHWSPAVRASTQSAALYVADAQRARAMREQGYATVATHRRQGLIQGVGAVVLLADRGPTEDVFVSHATAHFSLRKGNVGGTYPTSLTGSIALLRQVLHDVRWHSTQPKKEQLDIELHALGAQLDLPLFFEAYDRNDVLRIAELGKEFGLRFIVKGNGDEYVRQQEILGTGMSLVLPLRLPTATDVSDPYEALEVSLAQLKHWELAPHNATRMHRVDRPVAFTTHGLAAPADLWGNVRTMLAAGTDTALLFAGLTSVPAELLGLQRRCGALRPGMLANVIVTDGHVFSHERQLLETWVAGQRFLHAPPEHALLQGTYDLGLNGAVHNMVVSGRGTSTKVVVKAAEGDTTSIPVVFEREGELVRLFFPGDRLGLSGTVRLNGVVHLPGALWDGQGQLPDGTWTNWTAVRQREGIHQTVPKLNALDSLWAQAPGDVWYPMTGHGVRTLPTPQDVIFRNATVWTNGPKGILRGTDVLVADGLIRAVGERLSPAEFLPRGRTAVEVNATGKHLTCGIVDEHSHIAISGGANEYGQAVSSEVRIADVIDPDDVDIYRNLAGGVTTAQLLHGSANPIGGQSALVKLRWGAPASAYPIRGAPGFIKFALGENVKRSNSTDRERYPQTRMGVERCIEDAFLRAKAFEQERTRVAESTRRTKTPPPAPRRDLELEPLAEILRGERYITCHSYVQSEITMLMDLGERLGFKVNTFTHVLEGYKVADSMRLHGANASTFSDWWAYKFEVYEAIPHNGALLQEQGVNVAFNSDNAETARRLNQEAAKAVKYGGVPEEEAWKFVTLNPARMLHLDHRMGSVEPGKDADLVLWNTNPLSMDAWAERTYVDGLLLYDRSGADAARSAATAERERLIAKMLAAKKAGATTQAAHAQEKGHWHCDTLGEQP
jgi:imidazolonepropionase-like amidohydrolase